MERFLTDEELEKVKNYLSSPSLHVQASPYAIAALALLLYTGCRKSEVTQLRWSEVFLEEKYIYLKEDDQANRSIKTGNRTVPLNDDAINLLKSLKREKDNPYVFCGQKPRSHIVNITKAWQGIRSKLGVEDLRIHDLRHSFASFALKKGVDLYTVSKLLGHKNISTTTRYAHLELDALKEATNKIFA